MNAAEIAAHLYGTRAIAHDWRSLARFCAENSGELNDRELDFIATLAIWRGRPTERQLAWLQKIAARLRGKS